MRLFWYSNDPSVNGQGCTFIFPLDLCDPLSLSLFLSSHTLHKPLNRPLTVLYWWGLAPLKLPLLIQSETKGKWKTANSERENTLNEWMPCPLSQLDHWLLWPLSLASYNWSQCALVISDKAESTSIDYQLIRESGKQARVRLEKGQITKGCDSWSDLTVHFFFLITKPHLPFRIIKYYFLK